jgi:hypothetical protein
VGVIRKPTPLLRGACVGSLYSYWLNALSRQHKQQRMKKLIKQIIAFLRRVYNSLFKNHHSLHPVKSKPKRTIYMSNRTKKRIKNAKQQEKSPSYGMTFYGKSKGVKRKITLHYPKAKAA